MSRLEFFNTIILTNIANFIASLERNSNHKRRRDSRKFVARKFKNYDVQLKHMIMKIVLALSL